MVIVGVPFDSTGSFRTGSRFAPAAIRTASYNNETYVVTQGVELAEGRVFDFGNVHEHAIVDEMEKDVSATFERFAADGKTPLVLGGEHSASAPWIGAYARRRPVAVIQLDAHLDFRTEYLGLRNSHACAASRISDHVGVPNIVLIGVRSVCKEELDRAEAEGLRWFDSEAVEDQGIHAVLRQTLDHLRPEAVMVTLDMDGIDPAYAPGVGNPEPYGLSPRQVRQTLEIIGPRLAGFDVVEVCPNYDPAGITTALASRLAREALAVMAKHRR